MSEPPVLRAEHLSRFFPVSRGLLPGKRRFVHSVDDVNFEILKGNALGLVGESGCGKTTTGRMTVRLTKPTRGRILFQVNDEPEADIHSIEPRVFRRQAQMIFQDPYESLNPRMTVRSIVEEPLSVQHIGTRQERYSLVE